MTEINNRIEGVKKIDELLGSETKVPFTICEAWKGLTKDERCSIRNQICQLFPQPLEDEELRGKLARIIYEGYLPIHTNLPRYWHQLTDSQQEHFRNVADQILALLQQKIEEAKREIIDMLKNYGVSITNEGVLVPRSDEWDYLHDTPRRTLLRGNDKGESCKKIWQTLKE